ncbi:MAG TPA: hypothetical protein VE866_13965 [Candidatus Binatia bacterium]|nr:hypothetical protein [Candidatus Binatia bacterium]
MKARLSFLLALLVLLTTQAVAKDKNKSTLPEYVLRAQTVRVVIDPDAGEPLDHPNANAMARDNVEKALMEWGRFQPVLEGQESDLIVVVRAGNGRTVQPTIRGGPIDQRSGVGQSTDSSIRIGGQHGQPPPLTDPSTDPQQNQGPHMSNEVGSSQDSFAVYRGDVADPLDSSPVWRYLAKDCLQAPKVAAVEEFRKAIAKAEKPQPSKKP